MPAPAWFVVIVGFSFQFHFHSSSSSSSSYFYYYYSQWMNMLVYQFPLKVRGRPCVHLADS